LREILASVPGDRVRVGQLDGRLGSGEILAIDGEEARLQLRLDGEPPPGLPVTVVLALPRPKMLRRILRGCAEVGIKDLHLVHSWHVEKSYWQSPLLAPRALEDCLIAGLEQAMDTILPRVTLHHRFRPFAEDLLPALCHGREALLATPRAPLPYPAPAPPPALLVIGPERGFTAFEEELIVAAGARPVHLGRRVLRVETALHCALGRHLGSEA
jgi:RsmE family RNA methyltransferase